MLTPEERADLLRVCSDHAIASCPSCQRTYRFNELGSDFLGRRRWTLCPRCRQDLTASLKTHLRECHAAVQQQTAGPPWPDALDPAEERLLELLAQRQDDRFCHSCAAILLFASYEDVAQAVKRLRVAGAIDVDVGVCSACAATRIRVGIGGVAR
jgi:hypothetical protein